MGLEKCGAALRGTDGRARVNEAEALKRLAAVFEHGGELAGQIARVANHATRRGMCNYFGALECGYFVKIVHMQRQHACFETMHTRKGHRNETSIKSDIYDRYNIIGLCSTSGSAGTLGCGRSAAWSQFGVRAGRGDASRETRWSLWSATGHRPNNTRRGRVIITSEACVGCACGCLLKCLGCNESPNRTKRTIGSQTRMQLR